jgi:hypothetical protein
LEKLKAHYTSKDLSLRSPLRGIVREHGLWQSDLKKSTTYLFIKQIATSQPNTNQRFAPRNDVKISCIVVFQATNNGERPAKTGEF